MSVRGPRGLTFPLLVACVTLLLAALAAWEVATWLATPSDGTVRMLSAQPWPADHVPVDRVLRQDSPLRAGDQVLAIDGEPVDAALGDAPPGQLREGRQLRYEVRRGDEVLQVPVTLHRPTVAMLLDGNLSGLALIACLVGVATFVFWRRPRDPASAVLLLLVGLITAGDVSWLLGISVSRLVLEGPGWTHFAGELALTLLWGALWHFVVVFTGVRLPLLGRAAPLAGYAGMFLLYAGYLAVALPLAGTPLQRTGALVAVSLVPGFVAPVAVVALIVFAYRRMSDPHDRRRLLWVLVALGVSMGLFFGGWIVPALLWGGPLLPWGWSLLVFVPAPLALGAAILRYRLFDIEIFLRRSLLYGLLTAAMLTLYLAVAQAVTYALPPGRAPGLVALGVALLTFPVLRQALHRATGRLVYGEREDPQALLARLDELDLGAPAGDVLPAVAETLARRLRLPYAAIELYGASGAVEAHAESGTRTPGSVGITDVPLRWGERDVGRLRLDAGPGREPFGPADRRLLHDLSRHLGGTAYAVLLADALQESRARLVAAREEERRRLGRDLHDGLGPTLAAGTLNIEAAREVLRRNPDQADELLGYALATVQDGITDIRRLVEDLRPPSLDQLGLEAALREQALRLGTRAGAAAGRPVPQIAVRVEGSLAGLPAAVDVAVLRIVQEALHNAVRHGRPASCEVLVRADAEEVFVEVSDDGRGIPEAPRAGVGLSSMRERAGELGGTCTVGPRPGGGTVVCARLPLTGRCPLPVAASAEPFG